MTERVVECLTVPPCTASRTGTRHPGLAPGLAYHQAIDEHSLGAVGNFLAEAFRRRGSPLHAEEHRHDR